MNLVTAGRRTLNLDLVAMIEDRGDGTDGDGGVSVFCAFLGTLELKGAEAEALRRFVREHSRVLDLGPDAIPYSTEGTLPIDPEEPRQAEEG